MSNNQNDAHATPANLTSWIDVYHIFMDIADKMHDAVENFDLANKFIARSVESLYAQHQGDPAWDLAYERWIEPSDDDEEV